MRLAFRHLLHHLRGSSSRDRRIQCVAAEEYIDREYLSAATKLHSRAYRDYPRRTTRFHFFKTVFSLTNLPSESEMNAAYRGYCVVTPLEPKTLGRTFLRPEGRDYSYITCKRKESVHFLGFELEVIAAPFAEQDARVGRCATAALYMATSTISRNFLFRTRSESPAELTELATHFSVGASGGPFPSQGGLSESQIMWAIREIGLVPRAFHYRDPEKYPPVGDIQPERAFKSLTRTAYTFIESGLPLVVVIRLPGAGDRNHAATIIGHTYDTKLNPVKSKPEVSLDSSDWCDEFIVHCDQTGQYIRMKFTPSTKLSDGLPIIIVNTDHLPRSVGSRIEAFYKEARVTSIIAALPVGVDLPANEAAAKGRNVLLEALKRLPGRIELPDVSRCRTLLVAGSDLRREFQFKDPPCSEHLARLYRGSQFSRFVWVTEMYGDAEGVVDPEHLPVIGEVVFESSSTSEDLDFLSMHLPGMFFHMPPSATGTKAFDEAIDHPVVLDDDTSYQPYLRHDAWLP